MDTIQHFVITNLADKRINEEDISEIKNQFLFLSLVSDGIGYIGFIRCTVSAGLRIISIKTALPVKKYVVLLINNSSKIDYILLVNGFGFFIPGRGLWLYVNECS